MKVERAVRKQRRESGIALLISIFILLLISVIAISLIVSSGTESALAGNYRASTGVYYAALAGLEEVRGRLVATNPHAFSTTDPTTFLPPSGTPVPMGNVYYVLNPLGGEAVTPWDSTSAYPDSEYDTEFVPGALNGAFGGGNVATALSVWNRGPFNSLPFPGPLYKWVRINAVSENSLKVDVDGYNQAQSTTPLYYDGTRFSNDSTVGPQLLEITSLAVLPNGSQKLLQYLVTPNDLNLSFPAALTMDGPIGTFATSFNSDFYISGIDRQRGSPYPSPCPANDPTKYAIGAISSGDESQVFGGIRHDNSNNYLYQNYRGIPYSSYGGGPPAPSIGDISASLIPQFQTVNSLDGPQGVVQTLAPLANQQINGNATSLPDMGAPDRLVTTIVRGDLNLSGTIDGYGLLIVTGDLTLDGNVSWHGVILVVGQGNLVIPSYGFGQIIGAVLIARTRHNDGTLRPNLGHVTFNTTPTGDSGNSGFWYNSCWIQTVLPTGNYKVLSFHEISQ